MIKSFIAEGKLVPVEIVVGLIQNAMDLYCGQGKFKFLIDGFPRSFSNLEGWDTQVGDSVQVLAMLFFDCPEQVRKTREKTKKVKDCSCFSDYSLPSSKLICAGKYHHHAYYHLSTKFIPIQFHSHVTTSRKHE